MIRFVRRLFHVALSTFLFGLCAVPVLSGSVYADGDAAYLCVYRAPESESARALRYLDGLVERGLYEEAYRSGIELLGAPNGTNTESWAVRTVAALLRAQTGLWFGAGRADRAIHEKTIADLRALVEGALDASGPVRLDGIADPGDRLVYVTALFASILERASAARIEGRTDDAFATLRVVCNEACRGEADNRRYARQSDGDPTVVREYLFTTARALEEYVLCLAPKDPRYAETVEWTDRLLESFRAAYPEHDSFLRYLTARYDRATARLKDAASALQTLKTADLPFWLQPGLEAEQLRLIVAEGRGASVTNETLDAIRHLTANDELARPYRVFRAILSDRDLARLEALFAVPVTGKTLNAPNAPGITEGAALLLQRIRDGHIDVCTYQADCLLQWNAVKSRDIALMETAARALYHSGRWEDAIAMYDRAAEQAFREDKSADTFRALAGAAAILDGEMKKTLRTNRADRRRELMDRFTLLGSKFPSEKDADGFYRDALRLGTTLIKSGAITFDDYLALRIGYIILGNASVEFRFRTIALALVNNRAEQALTLLKSDMACETVPQSVLAVVLTGLKTALYQADALPKTTRDSVPAIFDAFDAELAKKRAVPLSWSPGELKTLELCRAKSSMARGKMQDAFNRYAALLKTDPDNLDVLEAIATIMSGQSNVKTLDRALEFWDRLAQRVPPQSEKWWLAKKETVRLYFRLGKKKDGRRLADMLIFNCPEKKQELDDLAK